MTALLTLSKAHPLLQRLRDMPLQPDQFWPSLQTEHPLTASAPSAIQRIITSRNEKQARYFRAGLLDISLRPLSPLTFSQQSAHKALSRSDYTVSEKTMLKDGENRLWTSFSVATHSGHFHVREGISSQKTGHHFPTAAACFRHALLHPWHGPWIATSIVTRLP